MQNLIDCFYASANAVAGGAMYIRLFVSLSVRLERC